MRHYAEFRSNRFGDNGRFWIFKSAILDFQKLKILTSGPVRKPNMRHHTKFRENRSSHSGDMADFPL